MKLELLKGSRTRILAAVLLAIVAVFAIRLFYLQVIKHDYYVALAKQEQQSRFVIPATRGQIYAKNGNEPVQLVMNEKVYTVFADPVTVDDKDKVVETMRKVAGGNVRKDFDKLLELTKTRYQILATKLTPVQADKIKDAGLHGIGFQEVSQRVYPEKTLASQILGFVDASGEGRYGIEGYENQALKGVDGMLVAVTDISNVPLTIGNDNIDIPAQNGKDIVLSVDRNVQQHVEDALVAGLQKNGAKKGSVLVMDPNTGKILAMANLPTYSPAEYNKVEDVAAFNNETISAPYEPGSDVKTFTLATGIDKNVVKLSDTYNNTDTITVADRTIGNATRGRTGIISFQTALTFSLNTGFVTIAQRLGNGTDITKGARDIMYDYFHNRLGLGQLTGVELANEAKGTVHSPDVAEGNAVRYSNMAFGQGLDATLIQVAAGFSALVNGGDYYKPTIIDGYMTANGFEQNAAPKPLRPGVVSKLTSDQVKQGTHEARTDMAASVSSKFDKRGYYIGGKTGTSQVIVDGQYSEDETVGTYLGYGGGSEDAPRYVIMVQVSGKDQKLRGLQDAQPIFTDISNWMLDYYKIQPKA